MIRFSRSHCGKSAGRRKRESIATRALQGLRVAGEPKKPAGRLSELLVWALSSRHRSHGPSVRYSVNAVRSPVNTRRGLRSEARSERAIADWRQDTVARRHRQRRVTAPGKEVLCARGTGSPAEPLPNVTRGRSTGSPVNGSGLVPPLFGGEGAATTNRESSRWALSCRAAGSYCVVAQPFDSRRSVPREALVSGGQLTLVWALCRRPTLPGSLSLFTMGRTND